MAGKYELKKTASGKFVFNLKAGNAQVILTSQTYESKSAAKNGIESAKKNSPDDGRFERKKSKNNDPFFVLKAANSQIIGKSEMYSSASSMENGIASVKKNGPDATLVDLTDGS